LLSSAHTVERAKKKAPCGGLSAAVFYCLRCRAGRAVFPLFPMRTHALPRPIVRIDAAKGPAFVFCRKIQKQPRQTGAVSGHFANSSLLFCIVSSLVPRFLYRSFALAPLFGKRKAAGVWGCEMRGRVFPPLFFQRANNNNAQIIFRAGLPCPLYNCIALICISVFPGDDFLQGILIQKFVNAV
jgi:hypothetical protein